jgi:hypothetical protein
MDALTMAAGILIVTFSGLLGFTILLWIWRGKISLSKLVSEANGDASMSRLQFLIFTFVISVSLFLIVVGNKNGPAFPSDIPPAVLALLGISAGSYLVSKGIQFANPPQLTQPALTVAPAAITGPFPATGVPLAVSIANAPTGTPLPALTWSLDAPAEGTLLPTPPASATWTPPAPLPATGTKVKIRAQAAGFEDGLAVITF